MARGADLQFDALMAGADHSRVDGAIVVLLGRRDIILEAGTADTSHGCGRLLKKIITCFSDLFAKKSPNRKQVGLPK